MNSTMGVSRYCETLKNYSPKILSYCSFFTFSTTYFKELYHGPVINLVLRSRTVKLILSTDLITKNINRVNRETLRRLMA